MSEEVTDMTKIKLCGLKRECDIEAANQLLPDFVGFIVGFPKSKRNVTVDRLRGLTAGLSKEIIPVGVFVDADPELVSGLLNDGTIGIAQLHGHENEGYIRKLRAMTDRPLMKAFSIKSDEDIELALKSSADYILLDHGSGGTGKTFDWSLVPRIDRPFFLAGGLSPENLEEALAKVKPWAVDLSSGIETDGLKDPEKMRRAVETVRKE